MKRALCTLLLVACSPLEVVELGVCGNGVLEPEEREDCDTYATAPNATCAPAGDVHECRYVCEKPGERGVGCPAGWRCGTDLVCRRPSGELADAQALAQPGGRWMDLADMDGDVQADLVVVDADRSTVVYLEGGEAQSTFQFPAEVQGPSFIAEASTDDFADLVIPTYDGLSTWQGTSERKLMPASYSYIPLPLITAAHLFTIDLIPDVVVLSNKTLALPGKEYLFVADGLGLAGFAEQWEAEETPVPGIDVSTLVRPAVGDFDELTTSALLPPGSATPEEFVLGAKGDAYVTMYRPILAEVTGADAPIVASLDTAPVQIDFIPPVTLGDNVLAVHLNAPGSGITCGSVPAPVDDHLDLLIDVVGQDRETHRTIAAFGVGDGSFHSDLCTLGTDVPDNRADQLAWLQCGSLLAAGDFDGDAYVDVATERGIWLSSLLPPAKLHDCTITLTNTPHVASYDQSWKAARLGDFDGNTLPDLVAIDGGRGLHVVLTTTATTPTIRQVPSNAPIEQMEIGDFDGNGADDVAYVELGPAHSLSILFGEPYAPSGEPIHVTTAAEIVGFTPVDMKRFAQPTSDGANELNLVTRIGDKVEAAILWGRTDRQIHAPLLVWPETFEQPYRPVTAAVGRFEANIEQKVLFTAAVREEAPPRIAGYAIAGANEMVKLQIADLPDFATSMAGGTALSLNLDGGGVDTPLAIGWRQNPRTTLVVGPDGPGSWTVNETPFEFADILPLGVDGLFGTMSSPFGEWSRHVDPNVQSCLIEPDGLPTAVFVAVKPKDCGHTTALYLLDAGFLAAALKGTGNPEAAEIVTGPEGETIVGVSCVQADLDDPEELVLVTLAPGLTCEKPSSEFTAHVYFADHDGNALGPPRRVSRIDTGIAPELRFVERLPITGVASGDATGDGVEDVMIGTVVRTLLLPGRPVNR